MSFVLGVLCLVTAGVGTPLERAALEDRLERIGAHGAPQLDCPQNTWCASYYDNNQLIGSPVMERQEEAIDHDWQGAGPEGLGINNFSVRWLGNFAFEEGLYRFSATSDDGMRIWVDDRLILDAWEDQEQAAREVEVFISGGVRQLRVDYYENTGFAVARVFWQKNTDAAVNRDSPLGINISALSYFSSEIALLDAMRVSGGWYTQHDNAWDTFEQEFLDLDENGWVRSLPDPNDGHSYEYVGALLLNGFDGHYPAGRYVVLYEGEGTLTYGFDGQKNLLLSRPGRDVVDVETPTNGGIVLRIRETDPDNNGNYLRNIRVIMPGYRCAADPYSVCQGEECQGEGCISLEELSQTSYFHPEFMRDLRRYKVIRFMDFLRTNTTLVSQWSERPRLEHMRWNTESGAPLEVAIALANEAGADPWFNIPIRADDDYIRSFAQMVLEQLDPERVVYIEYGNEIWNTAFAAGSWVEEQAVATWDDPNFSPYTKRLNWYAMRTVQMINLFKTIWGSESSRLRGIMGGFASNFWASEQMLDCPLWDRAPCYPSVHSLAIAPYIGGYLGNRDQVERIYAWSEERDGGLNSLFAELMPPEYGARIAGKHVVTGDSALDRALTIIERSRAITGRRGIELTAYEAGQHLAGVDDLVDDPVLEQLFIGANRDARMGTLYQAYLEGWKQRGGDIMCMFLSVEHPTRFGSWGSKEYQNQEGAPKFSAIMRFLDENPCWWDGCDQ